MVGGILIGVWIQGRLEIRNSMELKMVITDSGAATPDYLS